MKGLNIPYQSEVKYLGVTLDSRLKWSSHLTQKINKSKRAIMRIRDSMGKMWGTAPKLLKWAYEGIIIPALSYGCAVWSRACQDGNNAKKLSTLNRLMMLTMMPLRRSTPTMGLEVLLHIPPLDIRIKEQALNEMLRIIPHNRTRWDGCGIRGKGHIKDLTSKLETLGVSKFDFDSTKTILLKREFTIDLESFKSGLPVTNKDYLAFTDGSKLNQHTGYGLGIFSKNMSLLADEKGYLGPKNSVFQGEIIGIDKVCSKIQEIGAGNVTIFSDSQAAIAALANWKITSKTVEKCVKNLNLLSKNTNVEIKWVRSHSNFDGNEYADLMAKLGTKNRENETFCPPPISWAKQLIKQGSYNEWTQRWYYSNSCRQTKIWFPTLHRAFSRLLINLTRTTLGLMTEMITGHNRLNRHESLVDKEVSPNCRLCDEELETSFHIVAECPRLLYKRWEAFKTPFLDENPVWHPMSFLKFLRKAKIKEMNKRDP